jgi:predicted kinase
MDNTPVIKLPRRTLLVLAGPAGSGKSTFARRRFAPTEIVSSDYCRALVCDDENNQRVNRDAFDLFYYIIHKRMYQGRFTVADSTALQPEARQRLLDLAQRHGYQTCLLIFNVPEQLSRARNRQRARQVEEQVHGYHADLLQQTIQAAPQEGWHQLYILSPQQIDATKIEIET